MRRVGKIATGFFCAASAGGGDPRPLIEATFWFLAIADSRYRTCIQLRSSRLPPLLVMC
jgi:hypothetical protein